MEIPGISAGFSRTGSWGVEVLGCPVAGVDVVGEGLVLFVVIAGDEDGKKGSI
jgi:hypothetical protein